MRTPYFLKCTAGVMAGVMSLSLLSALPPAAFAADDVIEGETSDGFTYKITADTTMITGYRCDDKQTVTVLHIPETVEGRPVTEIGESAFSGYSALSTVTIPDTVTNLEWGAFASTGITEIKLPSSLTNMNCAVFSSCENLKSLTIPKGFKKDGIRTGNFWGIGYRGSLWNCPAETIILEEGIEFVPDYLCRDMPNLKTVVIPESVKEIGDDAFEYCPSLTDFTVPEGITSIGKAVFYGSDALADIALPSTLVSIGQDCFGKTAISKITLPEGVTYLGSKLFAECPNLSTVTIPSTVIKGDWALDDSNIETLTFADGMLKAPDYIGAGDPALRKINIPRSMTELGTGAFKESGILDFTLPKQITYANEIFNQSALETIRFEEGLTEVPEDCCFWAKNLKSIVWASTVTKIADNSFQDCDALESVEFPDTIKETGYRAFYSCDCLKSVRLPESKPKLGDRMFEFCVGLESVYLPLLAEPETESKNYYEGYGTGLFLNAGLKSISFAPEYTYIPNDICANCSSLTEIKWPKNVETVGSMAFESCTALTDLTIPDTVRTVREYAFRNCTGISELNLPKEISVLEANAFSGLTSLRSLYLPHELSYTGSQVFANSGIETIDMADGITKLEGTFCMLPELRNVHLPDSIIEIGKYTFGKCRNLTEIRLPASLEKLGDNAFGDCSMLTSLTVPKTVTASGWAVINGTCGVTDLYFEDGLEVIPDSMFYDSMNLRRIHIPASVREIGNGAFRGCAQLDTLDMQQDGVLFGPDTFYQCDALFDSRVDIYDRTETFINRIESEQGENGLVNYTVYYAVNPRFRGILTDSDIEVWTEDSNRIQESSLPVGLRTNEVSRRNIRFSSCGEVGVVRFSTRPETNADMNVSVTFRAKLNNKYATYWYSKSIPLNNSAVGKLSVSSRQIADLGADGNALIELTGNAPAGGDVKLYVNGEEQGSITADAYTGKFDTEIRVPAQPGELLDVYALSGEQKSNEITVTCQPGKNKVVRATLTHYAHQLFTLDITEALNEGGRPYFAFNPHNPVAFEVTLENNNCSSVFMTSTVNGRVSGIELEYDSVTGTWKGEGSFNPAVFGTLNVAVSYSDPHFALSEKNNQLYYGDRKLTLGEETQDYDDACSHFVNRASKTAAASDANAVVRAYSFEKTLGRKAGAAFVAASVSSVQLNGETVTAEMIQAAPQGYGFFASPITVTAQDGTVHTYYARVLTGQAFSNALKEIPYQPGTASAGQSLQEALYSRLSDVGTDAMYSTVYFEGTLLAEVSGRQGSKTNIILTGVAETEQNILETYWNACTQFTDAGTQRLLKEWADTKKNISNGLASLPESIRLTRMYTDFRIVSKLDIPGSQKRVCRILAWCYAFARIEQTVYGGSQISGFINTGISRFVSGKLTVPVKLDLLYRVIMIFALTENAGASYSTAANPPSVPQVTTAPSIPPAVSSLHTVNTTVISDPFTVPPDSSDPVTTPPDISNVSRSTATTVTPVSTTTTAPVSTTTTAPVSTTTTTPVSTTTTAPVSTTTTTPVSTTTTTPVSTTTTTSNSTATTTSGSTTTSATTETSTTITSTATSTSTLPNSSTTTTTISNITVTTVHADISIMTDISEPIEETPADGDDEFKDNWRENITQGANPNKLIDPSGIAYEWIPSNPVKGVRAEIYYQDETGKAVLWDAEHYSQINPQITDGAGWFAWDVPEGLWQVRLTADGYESVQSEWLPVLPVQTDVNLRLTSRLSSRIEIAEIDGRTVFVKFTKHMQDASITAENLYLTDAAGNIILCEITAQKETDNDTEASMYFTLTAESALALVNSTLHLTTGAKSYAGTASAAESIRLRGKVTEGDITGDGIVSIADAVMLARYASEDSTLPEGITENISNPRISDVDHDGSITVTDVTALLKLIAGVGYVR